jgi:hypothetical protein
MQSVTFVIHVSVNMLNVVMLNVVMMNVVMLSAVIPSVLFTECHYSESRYVKCRFAESHGVTSIRTIIHDCLSMLYKFISSLMLWKNKLECFSLASILILG